jgi:hypothetical protein
MNKSFRSILDRERTDRPSYSGTSYDDEASFERSLGQDEQRPARSKEIAKLAAWQRNDAARERREP